MSTLVQHWRQTTIDSDTLVERLQNPSDVAAWKLVEVRYGALVEAYARRLRLPRGMAEDARQTTMMAFAQAVRSGRFDRSRGRLRDLLFSIAKNKIINLREREVRYRASVETHSGRHAAVLRIPAENEMDVQFEREWNIAVAAQCLREARRHFRPETYEMFYMRAIDGLPSADVAGRVGKTVAAVDMAVHHVRDFLQQIRPQIEKVF